MHGVAIGGWSLVLVLTGIAPGWAGETLPLPDLVTVTGGEFVAGSDRSEREAAYRLDERAYGHSVTRKQRWYEREQVRAVRDLPTFSITRTVITNRQYQAFVAATGHTPPDVGPKQWAGFGLIHPFERTRRHAWVNGHPPPARLDHPVVLVSQADARAYADWLSQKTGQIWRLPGELEWEKAARGLDGRVFPWGDDYDAGRLNSHDRGPFDTVPVGHYPDGNSPFGLVDAAGQVFEWTADGPKVGRYWVKGGSWDDKGCGVCRPAARHSRPGDLRHILIGFRLVRE